MPQNTYTPIASVTLSASASEVVFTGLPQTFRDLILVFNGGCSQTSYCGIQFNGDTGSNYSTVNARFEVNQTTSEVDTTNWISQRYTGTSDSMAVYQIQDYSATNKHKTVLVRSNRPTEFVYMAAGRWANTNAITTISFDVEGTRTFNSGSTFTIYGVIA